MAGGCEVWIFLKLRGDLFDGALRYLFPHPKRDPRVAGQVGIEHAFDFRLLLDIFGPGVCRSNPRLMKFLLAGLGGVSCFLALGLCGLLLLQALEPGFFVTGVFANRK